LPTSATPVRQRFDVPPVDLRRTISALRRGGGDPTTVLARDGLWRAMHTADGPATLHVVAPVTDGLTTSVTAEAWGPGAELALARVPALCGAEDHPETFVAHHEVVAEAVRGRPGRRLPATGGLVEVLVPTIIEQKVTGDEARRAFRALCWRLGSEAPGPVRLRLQPHPDRLAELGYAAFHPLGIERKRADVILRVVRRADRIEALLDGDPADARRALEALPGLGPWTSGAATLIAFGDPDAVIVGDFWFPHLVENALTGRRRGSDAEMLAHLAPYVGHRARAQLVLVGLGSIPRRAPRQRRRDFAHT
jgi:3-methyladenine DNA glycosylase/8-oxoguanine DNA glycosylase